MNFSVTTMADFAPTILELAGGPSAVDVSQYKCPPFGELSIDNAEQMENFP